MFARLLLLLIALSCVASHTASAQLPESNNANTKRVTVSQNNDGSRTTYEIDNETRKAVATTTGADGKILSTIRYELDEAGRFAKGEVFTRGDQFRFKTIYKYDSGGRLESETQLTKDHVVRNKLVYSYDAVSGRQTGYAVYDGAGKLIGQTNSNAPAGPATSSTRPTSPKKSGR